MKLTLEIEEEYDFSILGISCHAKDYRLCWEINKSLGTELEKADSISFNEGEDMISYSTHRFYDEENLLSYDLIANKNEGRPLIQDLPQLDFFLKVGGPHHQFELERIKQIIQGIDIVLAVVVAKIHSLKSKEKLVF